MGRLAPRIRSEQFHLNSIWGPLGLPVFGTPRLERELSGDHLLPGAAEPHAEPGLHRAGLAGRGGLRAAGAAPLPLGVLRGGRLAPRTRTASGEGSGGNGWEEW